MVCHHMSTGNGNLKDQKIYFPVMSYLQTQRQELGQKKTVPIDILLFANTMVGYTIQVKDIYVLFLEGQLIYFI